MPVLRAVRECGTGNSPLSKDGAAALLRELLAPAGLAR